MYKSGISNISKINKIIVKSGNKKIVTEYWVQAQPAKKTTNSLCARRGKSIGKRERKLFIRMF